MSSCRIDFSLFNSYMYCIFIIIMFLFHIFSISVYIIIDYPSLIITHSCLRSIMLVLVSLSAWYVGGVFQSFSYCYKYFWGLWLQGLLSLVLFFYLSMGRFSLEPLLLFEFIIFFPIDPLLGEWFSLVMVHIWFRLLSFPLIHHNINVIYYLDISFFPFKVQFGYFFLSL